MPQDNSEAFRWYHKAAVQGYVIAQCNLGIMYCTGRGILQDDVMAYKWFNIAAAKDHEDAIINKGLISKRMTREQIAEAQKLSREWKPGKDR